MANKKLAKPPWVRYYPADFSAGVVLLSALEELAYRRICEQIYISGTGLSDNDAVMASFTKTEEMWLDVKGALLREGKIKIVDGLITNERSVTEYRRARAVYNQQIMARKKHNPDQPRDKNTGQFQSTDGSTDPLDDPTYPRGEVTFSVAGNPHNTPLKTKENMSSDPITEPMSSGIELELERKKEERGAPSQKKEAAEIDPNWQLTPDELAEERLRHPNLDIPREFVRFKLYYEAKGNLERSWLPKFRFWLVDQDGYAERDQVQQDPPPALLTPEEKAAADERAKDRRPQWLKDREAWEKEQG